ncbi:MAG: hypothetical protein ACFFD4_37600 [Candidatus Odinarchaeota archaeon]
MPVRVVTPRGIDSDRTRNRNPVHLHSYLLLSSTWLLHLLLLEPVPHNLFLPRRDRCGPDYRLFKIAGTTGILSSLFF